MEIELLQLLIIAIFFIFGFLISQIIKKVKYNNHEEKEITKKSNEEKEYSDIADIILTQYTEKLSHLEQKIIDFQLKLDIIDSKIKKESSHSIQEKEIKSQHHTIHGDIISQELEPSQESKIARYNRKVDLGEKLVESTTNHILKILKEKPLTSNEIKKSIGKTREHTSRLMKKLHEKELVERNIDSKPFKYKLTKLGEQYIQR